jgi:Holliday junction resolvase
MAAAFRRGLLMGRPSRAKGIRVEREFVHLHRDAGIPAERVPLSGAAGGRFAGDLVVAGRLRGEVKARKDGAGFATLERWLGDNDLLFLRRNRAEPLVVMPWAVYASLMRTRHSS